MKTCIVIPMKDPAKSKQRLANVLDSDQRQNLALFLFRQTLVFLNSYFQYVPVVVVTPSKRIADIAAKYGVKTLIEDDEGLNNALTMAAELNCRLGFESQLILPADITDLRQSEIQVLLDYPRDKSSVLICPAQDGGTNALLTTPPNILPFSFGPDSSDVHQKLAFDKSVSCVRLDLEKLSFDLDTPDDLYHWKQGINTHTLFAANQEQAISIFSVEETA